MVRATTFLLAATAASAPSEHTNSVARFSKAALCLHGRAATDEAVSNALVDHLAAPLDADIFAYVSRDSATEGRPNAIETFEAADVPRGLERLLNRTGRLVLYRLQVDSDEDVAAMEDAISNGSWYFAQGFAPRAYFDLSNHVACRDIVREHEERTGERYHVLAHSRMDVHYLEPLPRGVADEWRENAERADSEGAEGVDHMESQHAAPRAWKPDGVDNSGVLDLMSLANRPAWQNLSGVRDAVTAGLLPWNTASDEAVTSTRGFFPEQFTAAQVRACNVTLARGAWAYCRVDDLSACRYAEEARMLIEAHPEASRRYALTVLLARHVPNMCPSPGDHVRVCVCVFVCAFGVALTTCAQYSRP